MELKPCPLCSAEMIKEPKTGYYYHKDSLCPLTDVTLEEEDFDMWNTRTTPTGEDSQGKALLSHWMEVFRKKAPDELVRHTLQYINQPVGEGA